MTDTFTPEQRRLLQPWADEHEADRHCDSCASLTDAEGFDTLCPREFVAALLRAYDAQHEAALLIQGERDELIELRDRLRAEREALREWVEKEMNQLSEVYQTLETDPAKAHAEGRAQSLSEVLARLEMLAPSDDGCADNTTRKQGAGVMG